MRSTFSSINIHVPRVVTPGIKVRIFFKHPFAFIGIIFLFMGSIFPIVFGSLTDFRSTFVFSDKDLLSKGIITGKTSTGSSINDRRVYQYDFNFDFNDGSYRNHSFGTRQLEVGDTVLVQHVTEEPQLAKIQGMGTAPFGIWILLATLPLPVLGIIFFTFALKRAGKNIRLVENGIFTKGRVTRKDKTMLSINERKVYKIYFEFILPDGTKQESYIKSHKPDQFNNEDKEPILYDPQNPSFAVLVDTLPKQVEALLSPDGY